MLLAALKNNYEMVIWRCQVSDQTTMLQDVVLLDTLRGYWDSSDVALYYNYLVAHTATTPPTGTSLPLPHQRQELDPAYKSVA